MMGLKWLVSISKAMTSAGSLMTAVTGTLQAAQQQELIDEAQVDLLHSPSLSIVSEAPAGLQGTPMEALQDYLEQAGVSVPAPASGDRSQTAPKSPVPQASLAQGQAGAALAQADRGGELAGQPKKPWEIDPPVETLYGAVQDAGEGLTGGDMAEAQEKARELDETVHSGPRYGEHGDPPQRTSRGGNQLAAPQTADGLPPRMLSSGRGGHFQGTYTLKPDHTYTANGVTYHTDGNGAIQSWSATLTGPQQAAPRAPSHQKHLPGKLEGDHAGHYLAASEGGCGLADNLAPMDAKINTRDYRAFERENRRFLEEGDTVHLEGSNHMSTSTLRPDGIMVTRSVYDPEGNLRDREHFSWSNVDMSRYQGNDFGDSGIPNAMDESLEKAGITRGEIAALEGPGDEKNTVKAMEETERADRDQAGDRLGEAALTADQREETGRRSEQRASESGHGDLERRTEKTELQEAARPERDTAWTASQLGQKRSGKEQMVPAPSEQQAGTAEERGPERVPSEDGRRQPGDRQEAEQPFHDTWREDLGQGQSDSREADNDSARPWEKGSGQEAGKTKQADASHEPWKQKGADRDPGEKGGGAGRDKGGRQPDSEDQTPWKKEGGQGKESGGQPRDPAPSQPEKPDVTPVKEDRQKAREPWRRDGRDADDTPNQPRRDGPEREEAAHDAPKAEPKEEPLSHDDGSTKNKDGGYHY